MCFSTKAERRMSLATREQKAVVTDFCACRALWFFHAMKERIRIRLNKEKLTGHRGVYSKTISSIGYYTSITGANHLQGRTKPPQSCEERKPAPPNEEQFNAPTTGGHAMKERKNKIKRIIPDNQHRGV